MAYSLEKSRAIKLLLNQAKSLKANVERALIDSATPAHSRFVSFMMYAETYNSLAIKVIKELELPPDTVIGFDTARMKGAGDMLWGSQKQITETVAIYTDQLITLLEDATDYLEDTFDNISNFIKSSLRASMFSSPEKETEVQDNIERLFIGKGMSKGIEYDRESGKLEFSGKEYILLTEVLSGYVCAGIKKESEEYEKAIEILRENGLATVFIDNELLEGYSRISTPNLSVISNVTGLIRVGVKDLEPSFEMPVTVTPNDIQRKAILSIISMYDKNISLINQVKERFNNMLASFPAISKAIAWWDSLKPVILLSSVGRVIAHTNAKSIDPTLPELD